MVESERRIREQAKTFGKAVTISLYELARGMTKSGGGKG
jgi:hypothetical protein